MSQFGIYTTVAELHRSGQGSVFSATRSGESGTPVWCIRTCQPAAAIIGEDAARATVDTFQQRATTARRIQALAGCERHWAKIHEIGRLQDEDGGSGGVFFVTDLATRGTLEKLALGRIRLEVAILGWLMGEVVAGLKALRAADGRGHGNLKASNVLLIGPADAELGALKVVLADPVADERVDRQRDLLQDQRAIGELIHLAVLHSKFRGGWPLEMSPPFKSMGKGGAKWLEVVNTLLDPSDKAQRPDLDELATLFKQISVTKGSRRTLVVGGIAAAVLAIGIGTTLVLTRGGQAEDLVTTKWSDTTNESWRSLCDAYRGWYNQFQKGLDKPPTQGLQARFKSRAEAYAALDPQLKDVVNMPGLAKGFDPWSIARVAEGSELTTLARDPGKWAMADKGVEKTQQALATIEALRKALTENWQAPQLLREKAAAYRARGFTSAAEFLEQTSRGANPLEAADPAVAVDSVLSVVPLIKSIDAALEQISGRLAVIESAKDPVLAKFRPSIDALILAGLPASTRRIEDVQALEQATGRAADVSKRLAEFVQGDWQGIDTDSFYASAKFTSMSSAAPTIELFGDWMFEAKTHPSLDPKLDPRAGFDAPAELAAIDGDIRTLKAEPLGVDLPPAIATRLAGAKTEAQQTAKASIAWNLRNRSTVESRTSALKAELSTLKTDVGRLIQTRRAEISATASEVRAALTGRNEIVPQTASAAINAAWRGYRDGLLRDFKDEQYAKTRLKAKELEDALVAVQGTGFPAPLDRAGEGVPTSDWAIALAEATAQEREQRLAAALGALSVGGAVPDPSAIGAGVQGAGREYGAFVQTVRTMRQQLAAAETALNEGREAGPDGSLEALVNKWTQDPVGKIPAINGAISGLKERVQATQALKSERNIDALLARVLTPDPAKPELALAAWARLGDADVNWPASLEQAQRVREIRAELSRVIGRLPESRRASVATQVATDLRTRWSKLSQSASTPAQMEAALGLRAEYGVEDAQLEPRAKYNLLLSRLKQAAGQQGLTDQAVVDLLRKFDADVRGLGGGAGQAQPVARLLTGIAPIASGQEVVRPSIDPRTLGPGKAGGRWTASAAADGGLSFQSGQTTLEFVRVEPPGGEPAYIATREISLQDAIDILGASGGMSGLAPLMPESDPIGPRGWVLSGTNLALSPEWIRQDSLMTAQLPAYAEGIREAGQAARVSAAAGGEPQRGSPLQSITPKALAYIARSVGCRFLTPAEWSAAHQQFDGGTTPPGANLRDQTVAQQRAWVVRARQQAGARQDAFAFPDAGTFPVSGGPPKGESLTTLPSSDGTLWFRPTAEGTGRVKHLVGNVAEFVVSNPAVFEAAAPGAVDAMLGQAGVQLIGGSALSAPELPIDRPQPVDLLDALDGFADVGARLAFNASGTAPPRESFASRLNKLLTDEAYWLSGR